VLHGPPSPRLEHALADAVRGGLSLARAAQAVGIPEKMARDWVYVGRRGRQRYVRFASSIDDARREREHELDELVEALRRRVLP
jgi:hypothetical protein